MSKLLLTIAAAFLFTSTMAQAEVKTFNLTWSGASFSNGASATGFITFDTVNFLSKGNNLNSADVIDLGVTVTGSINGNGNFTRSDFGGNFGGVLFNSPFAPDFGIELIGQISGGRQFGPAGSSGAFNLFAANSDAPNGSAPFTLSTKGGDNMLLTSLTSVAAVPEADTSTMLLMGVGVMGFIARRRKQQLN